MVKTPSIVVGDPVGSHLVKIGMVPKGPLFILAAPSCRMYWEKLKKWQRGLCLLAWPTPRMVRSNFYEYPRIHPTAS